MENFKIDTVETMAAILAYCRAQNAPCYVVHTPAGATFGGTSAELIALGSGVAVVQIANGERRRVPVTELHMRGQGGHVRATVGETPTAADLESIMETDRCVEVRADGTVVDAPDDVYAPEVCGQNGDDPDRETLRRAGWELLRGYTAQSGYRGPVMTSAEHIRGRLAEDILSEPGIYVAVTVADTDGPDQGWAVARKL